MNIMSALETVNFREFYVSLHSTYLYVCTGYYFKRNLTVTVTLTSNGN